MRIKHRVDGNQAEIIQALELAGCVVWDTSSLGFGGPDLVVCYPNGRDTGIVLMEVKSKNGKLTEAEKTFFVKWPGAIELVYSAEDALRAIGR